MFLHLELPEAWTLTHEPHQSVAVSPTGVIVAWGPLLVASGDDARLVNKLLAVALDGRQVTPGEPVRRRTDRGWSYTETPAVLDDGEQRLAVVYQFDEWRGTALVRVPIGEIPPEVQAALARAVPDWRSGGEIVCVADLYEGVP